MAAKGVALASSLKALEESCPKAETMDSLREKLVAARAEVLLASARDTAAEMATGGNWVRALPANGELRSASGDTVSLTGLNIGNTDTPHGVCSAPKMIQAARSLGYTVVGMAEAWYGGSPNTHGELVASCKTCMKNIGFQLCGVAHA